MNYKDELYHFGIPGMKWGVRRFQNLNGTLTPAGKARYGNQSGSNSNDKSRRPKKASEMTDAELSAALNRLRNEKAYNELTAKKPNPVARAIINAGREAALSGIKMAGNAVISQLINDIKKEQAAAEKAQKEEEVKNAIRNKTKPEDMSDDLLSRVNSRLKSENSANSNYQVVWKQREQWLKDDESQRYEAWLRGRAIFNRSGYR